MKNKTQIFRKHKNRKLFSRTMRAASVDVELTGNAPSSSQNFLLDASTSSAVNDLHGIASSFNNTTGSSYESPSMVSSSSGQQQQAASSGKKEGHLFGWFASSTSTSTSSAVHNMSVTSNSSSATASPPTVANRSNLIDATVTNGRDDAESPSTKISSKLSYGEMFKFSKNGNKATALDQPAVEHPPEASSKEHQQKSSRRTTSLLNLFMSNSQGKEHIYIQNSADRTSKLLPIV
jgi:hypothetical protein